MKDKMPTTLRALCLVACVVMSLLLLAERVGGPAVPVLAGMLWAG